MAGHQTFHRRLGYFHNRFIALAAALLLPAIVSAQSAADKVAKMNGQILSLGEQGKYADALALAKQAVEFSKQALGAEAPATADCLNDLGGVYEKLCDFTNAEEAFQRGLAIREKVLGPEHQYTARNLNNLGVLYTTMGRYSQAEPLLQRALAINEKAVGHGSVATASSLSSLGILYQSIGSYDKALDCDEQVREINRELFGANSPEFAAALSGIGMVHVAKGDLAGAKPLLEESLAIAQNKLGAQNPAVGNALATLGVLYYKMGDFAKSESFYQRALAILEKNPGPDHPSTASAQGGLASLYLDIGDYEKAVPLVEHTLEVNEKIFGPQHPIVAVNLSKLAGIYEKIGNWKKAEELEKQVLSIDEKAFGTESPATASVHLQLGKLYADKGSFGQAEAEDLRAEAIQEKEIGTNHPDFAVTLNNLAMVSVRRGDYARAEPLMQRALEIDRKMLGPEHPATANNWGNLASVDFDLQKTNEALHCADEAEQARLAMLDNILSFTSEQQRLNYEAQTDPYVFFASLNDSDRMAQAILRHKGVVLDSLLEDRLVAQAGENAGDEAEIEQLRTAKRQLTELLMTVPKDFSRETLKKRAKEREKLSSRVDKLESALAQNIGGIGHARRALTVTVAQVQQAIPPQAVLLEFASYNQYLGRQKWERRYGAAILSHDGKPKWISLGAADAIEKNVMAYQLAVRELQQRKLSHALHDLDRQIWEPLEMQFPAGTKTVIISPDLGLNFISFATLLGGDDHFLAEKYSLRYVASGRDLLLRPVAPSNQDMVIFAAPDYVGSGEINWPPSGLQLNPLPYFQTNAVELANEVKQWNWPVEIFSGTDATESQARAVQSPRILHFATHGFLLPPIIWGPQKVSAWGWLEDAPARVILRNPMERSGVALAGAQVTLDAWKRGDVPATDNDGILTAEEVGGLNLQGTWLVVLSACDTGIGMPRIGEGVMGLRRGFVQAGAQNLLMTLWPVFDVSSGKLMLDFYSKLHEDNNPAEALAEVQRNLLVKMRAEKGLLPAVEYAGAFIVNSQGPVQ